MDFKYQSIPTIKDFSTKVNQNHGKEYFSSKYINTPKICCVPHCRSNINVENGKFIRTFPFPRIEYRQNKWYNAINLKSQNLLRPHICINHFEVKYLVRCANRKYSDNNKNYTDDDIKLRSDAIPTLLLDNSIANPYSKSKISHYIIPNSYRNPGSIPNQQILSNKMPRKIYIPKCGNFCRICLTENVRFVPLAIYKDNGLSSLNILPAGKLFEEIVGVKIENLPYWLKICFICYNKIEDICEFQQNAQTIHKNLLHIRKYPHLIKHLFSSFQSNIAKRSKINDIASDNEILIDESDQESIRNANYEFDYPNDDANESAFYDNNNEEDDDIYLEQTISDQENEIKAIYPKQEDVRKYFQCQLKTCKKIFLSKINFNDHISRHHKIKSYRCKICNKWFYELLEFEKHQKQIHSNGVSYKCPKCSRKFTNIYQLSVHRKVHESAEYCTICDKNIDNLASHLKSHNIEETVQCWICFKTFTNSLNFKSHLHYVHTERTFICNYGKCKKQFKRKTHLQKHLDTHYKPKNVYYCETCHKRVYYNVDKHIQRHKIKEESSTDQYKCHICGDVFINFNYINHHSHTVHNSRKYKCSVPNCSLQFIRKAHFENHVRAHSNPKNEKLLETLNQRFMLKLKLEKDFYGNASHTDKTDQILCENDVIGPKQINNKTRKNPEDEFLWSSIEDDDENMKILLGNDQSLPGDGITISENGDHQNYLESQENQLDEDFKACFSECPESIAMEAVTHEIIQNFNDDSMKFENLYDL